MTAEKRGCVYWAPLFHFYQPPTQRHSVLRQIAEECYRPLVKLFLDKPNARATFNINAVLTEMLDEHGYGDVLDGLRELGRQGRVEFVGSAKYHAILPLIPAEEQRRQIRLNLETNRHLLGEAYSPQGLFPPEMCYGPEMLEAAESTGHRWLILSGVASSGPWPMNVVDQAQAHDGRLGVFFRDDVLSNLVSFRKTDAPDFLRRLRDLGNYHPGDVYVVTAQDAETFGHHIKDWEKEFLGWVFQELSTLLNGLSHEEEPAGWPGDGKPIRVVTISQLQELFPAGPVLEPHPSSWSTTTDDLKEGNPYPLWSAPGNRLHALLWEHLGLVIGLTNAAQALAVKAETRQLYKEARATLDEALHSDQFWWASRRPMWNADMVHRGLLLQQEALVLAYNAIEASGAPVLQKREHYHKVLLARGLRAQIEDLLLAK